MSGTHTSSDLHAGRLAAQHASAALLALRAEGGPDLGRRGDALAQSTINSTLVAECPEDTILSEEARDRWSARRSAERVWIVDPLDGTREYGEAGRHDWAVHIALWVAGRLSLGVVALPALGEIVDSDSIEQFPPARHGRPRFAASRTRPPELVGHVERALGADVIAMGSAGYKILSVVRGETDAYVHAGGQFEWDSAAPVAIARAAGLHTSRIDGSSLEYNRADPRLPDLLVCRPDLAGPILDVIAGVGEREGDRSS